MKKTLLSLAFAAAAFVPGVAQAQFNQTCWTPSTQAVCLSWRLDQTSATSLDLYVFAWGSLSPIRFTDIGLFNTGATGTLAAVNGVTGVNVNIDGIGANAAGFYGSINLTGEWSNSYGNNLSNVTPKFGASASTNNALIADNGTQMSFGGVQTTATDGTSYLKFNFTTNQAIAEGSSIGFFAQGNGVSLKCFSDPNNVSVDRNYECGTPPQEVPEPASFGLVFAGLAGLAGMTALRRRTQA